MKALTMFQGRSPDVEEYSNLPAMVGRGSILREDITKTQITSAAKLAVDLLSAGRFEVFDSFVSGLPGFMLLAFMQNEQFRRALIDLRSHQHRYEEICELIKDGSFTDGSDLLDAWDRAHYGLWEKRNNKPLSALTRFRIRKKNPPPPSICQGGRLSRNLDSSVRAVLMSWFQDHADFPYPTSSERYDLAQKTGLTNVQIKTWFANARRRRPTRKVEKIVMNSCAHGVAGKSEVCFAVSADSDKHGRPRGAEVQQQQRPYWQPIEGELPRAGFQQQYLQPLRTSEPTGIRGLMQMYNRLTVPRGPGMAMPWYPPDHPYRGVYSYSPACRPLLPQRTACDDPQLGSYLSASPPSMSRPNVSHCEVVMNSVHPHALHNVDALEGSAWMSGHAGVSSSAEAGGGLCTGLQSPERPAAFNVHLGTQTGQLQTLVLSPVPVVGSPAVLPAATFATRGPALPVFHNYLNIGNGTGVAQSPMSVGSTDAVHTAYMCRERLVEELSLLPNSPSSLYGEFAIPHSLDNFHILQSATSSSSESSAGLDATMAAGALQMSLVSQDPATHTSHRMQASADDGDDEAAHILLHLAATKTKVPTW